jgi:hypothetical protein
MSAAIIFPAEPPAASVVIPVLGVRHDDGVKRLLEGDLQAMVREPGPPIVLFIAPASNVEPPSLSEETTPPPFGSVTLSVIHGDDHRLYVADVEWGDEHVTNLHWQRRSASSAS